MRYAEQMNIREVHLLGKFDGRIVLEWIMKEQMLWV
jgi:hypothetical protein